MLRISIFIFSCLFFFSVSESVPWDFTRLPPTAVAGLKNHPCISAPNPESPAYRAFFSGRPAGAGLAGVSWPLRIRIGVVRVEFQPDENPLPYISGAKDVGRRQCYAVGVGYVLGRKEESLLQIGLF